MPASRILACTSSKAYPCLRPSSRWTHQTCPRNSRRYESESAVRQGLERGDRLVETGALQAAADHRGLDCVVGRIRDPYVVGDHHHVAAVDKELDGSLRRWR